MLSLGGPTFKNNTFTYLPCTVLETAFNKSCFFADKLKEREQSKLPDSGDVDGAAHGLVRLYSLYKVS